MKTKRAAIPLFLVALAVIAAACSAYIRRAGSERVTVGEMWVHGAAGVKLFPKNTTMKMYTRNLLLPPYTASFNSEGFRDRDYSRRKPPNTVRIIVLGDSYAFGWGVEQEETFDNQLERFLRKKHAGLNVEALNMAIPGVNHVSELKILREIGIGYDPDIVLVFVTWDDIFPDSNGSRAGGVKPLKGVPARFMGAADGNKQKEQWLKRLFQIKTADELKENGIDVFFETFAAVPLREMNALAAERGFRIALVCYVNPPLKNYYDSLAEELGIGNIFLDDAYEFKTRVLPGNARMMIRGDGHPTADAQRLYAYYVADRLEMPKESRK